MSSSATEFNQGVPFPLELFIIVRCVAFLQELSAPILPPSTTPKPKVRPKPQVPRTLDVVLPQFSDVVLPKPQFSDVVLPNLAEDQLVHEERVIS